jgi:pimeloyl-ACP methyl ester carboxylesterase
MNTTAAEDVTVTQTPVGPVAWRAAGSGPTVVSLHGVLGGHAQGLSVLRFLTERGFRVLAPSRPGYEGTPLSVGPSIEAQADAVAHLLDALDIGPVAISGASAGGPTALQFALRHRDRTAALVLLSAVTTAPPKPPSRLQRTAFANRMTFALMARFTASRRLERGRNRSFIGSSSTYARPRLKEEVDRILADPVLREQLRTIFPQTRAAWREAVAGAGNDIRQTGSMPPLPFDQITRPTLVVHGDADGTPATFAGAEQAAALIPDATLHVVPDGWHMVAASVHAPAMEEALTSFLRASFEAAEVRA